MKIGLNDGLKLETVRVKGNMRNNAKRQENEKWLETIEWMYDITGFHKETREPTNVYFVKG